MIATVGADAARMYSLFATSPDRELDWQEDGVEGVHRFLSRVYRLVIKHGRHCGGDWKTLLLTQAEPPGAGRDIQRRVHQTIKRITIDFEGRWHFNTSISAVMELVNELYLYWEGEFYSGNKKEAKIEGVKVAFSDEIKQGTLRCLVLMLAPFAPYLATELWEVLGEKEGLLRHPWPEYDPALAKEDEIQYAVQINGKLRSHVSVAADSPEEFVRERAMADEKVRAAIEGKQGVKKIVVPGKLVNVVVK